MNSIGPHGIDTSVPRGIKPTRIVGLSRRVAAALQRGVTNESAKRRNNASRASSSSRAGQA